MNIKAPVLVGTLITTAVVILTSLVMTTTKDKFGEDSTYPLHADFKDAAGIRWKTRVQINGIDVGKIDRIEHVTLSSGGLTARVTIRILKEYAVYDDAIVKKAAESLLGDYRLDLYPGTPTRRRLEPGEVIGNVTSRSEMDEIQTKLNVVAGNVEDITASLKTVLAGEKGEGSLKEILMRVERATQAIEASSHAVNSTIATNQQSLDNIIKNLDRFSKNLAASSDTAGDDIKTILADARKLSGKLNNIADSVSGVMGPSEDELKNGVASLRETLDTLNDTLAHVQNVSKKIDKGDGTVGRLINDPTIANTAEDTLEDVSVLVAGISDLQTKVDIRSEYMIPLNRNPDNPFGVQGFKSTVSLKLQPRPDKYYLMEIISDPRGAWNRKFTIDRSYNQAGEDWSLATTSLQEQNEVDYGSLKFSAQFAKRFYFVTLRLGIFENTGGFGFNLHFFQDKLELKTDLYDFDFRDQFGDPLQKFWYARIRTMALWEFYPHIYVNAGIDDPLNPEWFSAFVGGGVRFTDEDLKSILTVAPMPAP